MKNRIKYCSLVLFIVVSMMKAGPALAAGEGSLTGNWARDDGTARIKIVECGENFCATNTWVKDPNGKEHVGDELVLAVKPVSSTVLEGQAYDVRRNMKYRITITMQPAAIRTSGCILFGMLCKSADWKKEN